MALIIKLADDFEDVFKSLIEKTPFEDEGQVLSNAIALMDLVCEAREFGFRIAIVTEEGEIEDYIQGF